jgi:exopolyphosphatase/guanosine-5'-triphosphate,3'-diphosphate pyrophosphatase
MIRRAVIDVGTNSVKLLVADVDGVAAHPVFEQSHQTRLGQGFYETHRLQPAAIARTAEAVAQYAVVARGHGAAHLRVIATSAARDAQNSADLAAAIRHAASLPLGIISGDQEAAWAFQGVLTNPALANGPLLLLDVGGGSAEFILGRNGQSHFRQSFPLGSVRLLEKFPPADPPAPEELPRCQAWLKDFLGREVGPQLLPALRREAAGAALRLVGTGGSASVLGTMTAGLTEFDRDRIEAVCLSREQLRDRVEELWRLPLERRRQIPGLPANRADVILMGAAIYEAIMAQFDLAELRLSTRGLRFGAVLAMEQGPAMPAATPARPAA